MRRRDFLALALAASCHREDKSASPSPTTQPSVTGARLADWQEVSFPASAHYPEAELATILQEKGAPLLVALHGRGEAGRGLPAGARGWRDDYHLDRARTRLAAPPLTIPDFQGFVRPERLKELNASLSAQPYRGLALACPYTPVVSDRSVAGAQAFAAFVMQTLLPKAAEITATKLQRDTTGIDGVSMGGRLALLVGLSHPEVFGAVAALQPAIRESEADELATLAASSYAKHPFRLRLVSSEEDPFLEAVLALSAALKQREVQHQLVVTPGPHDYVWNRGPGSLEMLLWHERALHGEAPP